MSPSTAAHPALAREGGSPVAALWRASQFDIGRGCGSVPSQHALLDAELPGGGWPRGALTEVLCQGFGVGELRLVLPAVAALARADRPVCWIAPPAVPYPPALRDAGLSLDALVLIEPGNERDTWWAIDQAMKCSGLSAVLAWLPESRVLTPADRLRRLQLAASGTDSVRFVFRPLAARRQASAAALRLALEARTDGQVAVSVVKRRGPPCSAPIVLPLPLPALGRAGTPLRGTLRAGAGVLGTRSAVPVVNAVFDVA